MREAIRQNRQQLKEMMDRIKAFDLNGKNFSVDEALERAILLLLEQFKLGGKLILIGNGGSAAIASHMATDFWKNAGIPAIAFNDSSLLTCVANDLGYAHVFEKPLKMFAQKMDVLIAISSSGKSENILKTAAAAQSLNLRIITLSGFQANNPLKEMGEINFYVPVSQYGYVEVIHHSLLHTIIDVILKNKQALFERPKAHEQI